MKARWNNQIVAESDDTIVIENNHYFPAESLRREFFQASDHTSVCGWKGLANYYDIVVNGQTNANAAWTYREPKPDAASIKDYVAFWKGVEVSE
ncbi:MAG: DUF427 domain-containing protein [Symploca sp. SIO2G7]|nr:DUF427 domain-containing protein [Symploca sp. SIO2G7]